MHIAANGTQFGLDSTDMREHNDLTYYDAAYLAAARINARLVSPTKSLEKLCRAAGALYVRLEDLG